MMVIFINFIQINVGYTPFGNGNKAMICSKGFINALEIPKRKVVLFVDGLETNLTNIFQTCNDKCLVKFIHK